MGNLLEPSRLEKETAAFRPARKPRRFSLPAMLWLGLFGAAHAEEASMEKILDLACASVEGQRRLPLRGKTLTQSGWSRAKGRLPLGLLRRLWRRLVAGGRFAAGEAAAFHGLRLVALDKKTFTVPEALWETFGSHKAKGFDGPAQASLLMAYDVLVRVPLAFTLARVDRREHVLAPKVLRAVEDPSLLLVDAGFYSFLLFHQVREAGHHFLARMRATCKPRLVRSLGPHDGLYEIEPGHSLGERVHGLPKKVLVRVIEVRWKGFRPVRLATSLLDPQAFPREDFLDLYHSRWHVETFFRELQEDIQFEHWHTATVKGLYVELLFIMLYVTAVRAEMAKAALAARRVPGDLSFGRAAPVCLRAWAQTAKWPSESLAILGELRHELATLAIDVRPGRRFERSIQKRRAQARRKKPQPLKSETHAA